MSYLQMALGAVRSVGFGMSVVSHLKGASDKATSKASQSLKNAQTEKRRKVMTYKDVQTNMGLTLGQLTKNLSAEQKKNIAKQARPYVTEMNKKEASKNGK